MRYSKRPFKFARTTAFALIVSLCLGLMLANFRVMHTSVHAAKNDAGDRRERKLSTALRRHKGSNDRLVRVILQLNDKPSAQLKALLRRNGIRVHALLQNLNSQVVELPVGVVDELADFDEADFISVDNEVQTLGHVTSTTGTEAVRTQTVTSSTGVVTTTTLDGTGIGVAILDSGIYATHHSFGSRIVYSKDFTGENRTDDPYGHGTHVAALAAGSNHVAYGAYTGVAPNANLINLRVLNSQGKGTTSGLLGALDWVLANRTPYNIRVVNMSLGTAAVDSYKNDPVCRAVRRLVDAGVVVVAAAGNNGKDISNNKLYGQIHSPGNELSAITVGASNTYGTDARGDDGVATYSSRGPTRSYTTDGAGTKHYDNLVKPDLVAPGNKIISAQSPNNFLVKANSTLKALITTLPEHNQMYMNGTSMAAPVVAGAAALLLQANPKLTPNMVKMILMYTAQPLRGNNTLEQGAGELNLVGAVKLAKLVRTDLVSTTAVGASLLTTATLPTPQSTIAGQTFTWAQGIILDHTFATGSNIIGKYQKVYGQGVTLSEGVMLTDGTLKSDPALMSSGVLLSDQLYVSSGVTISEGTNFLGTGVLLSDGVMLADGVMVSDGIIRGDGVMVSDGVMLGDSVMLAQAAMTNGDGTSAMLVAPDNGVEPAGN
ncbi:MAG: S8 family serine peptidase [Pyrinomonadaceae bacterium]